MQLTRPLWRKQADLLAADATSLANGMLVHLMTSNTPATLDALLTDVTAATFTGSAALVVAAATQETYYDATSGLLTLRVIPPAGGWHWACTVTPGSPEVIYGVYVTDNPATILYGIQRLAQAVTISVAGQAMDVDDVVCEFLTSSPR